MTPTNATTLSAIMNLVAQVYPDPEDQTDFWENAHHDVAKDIGSSENVICPQLHAKASEEGAQQILAYLQRQPQPA